MAATSSVQVSSLCDTQAESSACLVPAFPPAAPSSLTPLSSGHRGTMSSGPCSAKSPCSRHHYPWFTPQQLPQKPDPVCTWWDKCFGCIRYVLQRKMGHGLEEGSKLPCTGWLGKGWRDRYKWGSQLLCFNQSITSKVKSSSRCSCFK